MNRSTRLETSRAPLTDAKRVQRLETEARTIAKLVNGETKNLWPPIDGVTVTKGYEKAIGAALGDDLDAPVDPSAPMRWTNAGEQRRSVVAGRRRCPRRPRRGAARTGASSGADRRRGEGARRGTGVAIEDRPAAGVAGRRCLALGRFCRRRARADRRRTASRRTGATGRYRARARAGPRRCGHQAPGAGRRRGRIEGGVRRRDRRPRGLARRPARGRRRARTPCHDRA